MRLIPWCLALALLVAVPLLLPAGPAYAQAETETLPEDLQEVLRLELEGRKVDAFLKLKDMAPLGDPEAQYRLAGYYHYGYAGPADFKLALDWYERAARQGHPDAMLGIGVLNSQENIRIPQNKPRAFTWLTIAATLLKNPSEVKVVEGLRDRLKSELSSAELNVALAEAMAYQPVPEQPQ